MASSNHSQWDSHPDIGPQPACTGADLDNETGFWERRRPIDPFVEQKESDSVDDQQEEKEGVHAVPFLFQSMAAYTTPCSIMASATFLKPAILAPKTRLLGEPNCSAVRLQSE